jgi:hypothetical protein
MTVKTDFNAFDCGMAIKLPQNRLKDRKNSFAIGWFVYLFCGYFFKFCFNFFFFSRGILKWARYTPPIAHYRGIFKHARL